MPKHPVDPTETEIQAWCSDYLRKKLRLKTPSIDANADFAKLGLDSMELVLFVAAIEDWLGLDLSAETTMEYRTIATLAHYLTGQIEANAAPAIVR